MHFISTLSQCETFLLALMMSFKRNIDFVFDTSTSFSIKQSHFKYISQLYFSLIDKLRGQIPTRSQCAQTRINVDSL